MTEMDATGGDPLALEGVLLDITDTNEHDLVALQWMFVHPTAVPALCPRLQTSTGRAYCARWMDRPHLGGVQ